MDGWVQPAWLVWMDLSGENVGCLLARLGEDLCLGSCMLLGTPAGIPFEGGSHHCNTAQLNGPNVE